MNEINDKKQNNPQTTFGLVTLNHFGISVRDLDRSIVFYRLSLVKNLQQSGLGLVQV